MLRLLLSLLAVPAMVLASTTGAWSTPDASPETDLSTVGPLLDELVPQLLDEGDIPGAAVAVVAGGKTVFSKGYGLADIDAERPVSSATGFYAGSTAKLFTAAAVLQLLDVGKLDLHTDVNEYLTKVEINDTYPGRPVTLQHLLTHTAGFDPDYAMVGTSSNDPNDLPSLAETLAAHQPPRIRPPGTVLAYDNYGVALAGLVVEEVSGKPYDTYVNEHIYGPLKMSGSTASQPHPKDVESSLATGYRPSGSGQAVTGATAHPLSPAGPGQVVTTDDMARFMIDQLSVRSALGANIPRSMQHEQYAQDPRLPGIGYIYEAQPHDGVRVLAKSGDTSGFHNQMYLLPEVGVGLFIAVNGDGNETTDLSDVLDAVVDTYFPAKAPSRPRSLGDSDVSKYEGAYQSSRVSHHSIVKVMALSQSLVRVTANPDGTVTTRDRTLSSNPDADQQRWVQIGEGLFQEVDGAARIAFSDDGVLTASRATNQVYLEVTWHEDPALHMKLALLGIAGLMLSLLAIPTIALIRRIRGKPSHAAGARAARLIAWATAVLALSGVAAFVMLVADSAAVAEKLFLGAPQLYVAMVAMSLALLGTVGVCVAAATAWWRAWWGPLGRVGYSLVAVSAVAFSAIALTYNFIGPPCD